MRILNTVGKYLSWALNVPPVVIVLAFVIFFIARWHGGYLNEESLRYYSHYTADRPVLVKLLDCKGTDSGMYQARELSYVFDYLDYNLCRLCAKWGLPHYLSVSSYAGLIVMALLLSACCRNLMGLSRPMTNSLLLLFLTHPNALFLGPVYRSAKIGAAVCLTGLCYVAVRCRDVSGRPSKSRLLAVFLLSFAAAWFDRQGFFLACGGVLLLSLYSGGERSARYAVAVILAGIIISRPYEVVTTLPKFAYSLGFFVLLGGLVFLLFYFLADRNAKWVSGTMCAALAFHQIYNRWIMPAVMERVVGYRPSFKYQTVDPNFVLGRVWMFLGWGAGIFSENLRWLLGALPLTPCIVLCLAALWITLRDSDRNHLLPRPSCLLRDSRVLTVLVGTFLVMFMFSVMVCTLRGILLDPMPRMVYYPIPSGGLVLLGLAWMISPLRQMRLEFQRCGVVVLTALFVLNLVAWPAHIRTVEKSNCWLSRNSGFRTAASGYLAKGFCPIPVAPAAPTPLISWKAYRKALPSVQDVAQWWRDHPANVGIVTGTASGGLVVVEVDGADNLFRHRPELADAPCVVKGSAGRDYYFRLPAGAVLQSSLSKLAARVSVRAEDDFVIAPPSTDENGNRYRWQEGRGLENGVPVLPESFLQTLKH